MVRPRWAGPASPSVGVGVPRRLLPEGVVFGATIDQYIAYDFTEDKTAVLPEPDHPIARVNGWTLWESGMLQPSGEDLREVLPEFS